MRNRASAKAATDALGQVPMFRSCSREELKALDRATTRVEYSADDVLCRQGTVGRELVILLEGQAAVARDGIEITTVGPGDFIGEMSLLDGGPRSATVTALTDISALVLLPNEFWQVVDAVPPIAHKLLSSLAGRLRAANAAAYHL